MINIYDMTLSEMHDIWMSSSGSGSFVIHYMCFFPLDTACLVSLLTGYLFICVMDGKVMEEEDECPELVPIETPPGLPTEQIPVTIITGYLGEGFI